MAHSNREFFYNRRFSSFKNEKKPQPTQRRRKDVVKRLIFGLKDVLDWSEMEIAMNFFYDVVKTSSKRRPRDAFHEMSWRRLSRDLFQETSSRPLAGDVPKTSKTSSRLFLVKTKEYLETIYGFSIYIRFKLLAYYRSIIRQTN